MDLNEKVILITGAAVRLGREMAEALARRGAKIAIHYRSNQEKAEELAAQIGGQTFQADLSDLDQVEALPGRVLAAMGRLDALVNSAAVFVKTPFGEVDAKDWAHHMDVNLKAPFFLSQAFYKALPEEQEGRILNMTDARGDLMDRDYPAYSLSKAGMQSMTRGLALSLGPRVRVFGLALGQMIPVVGGGPAPRCDAVVPGFASEGATGEAAAFLLGPGDFATGHVLYLDGGRHLSGGSL